MRIEKTNEEISNENDIVNNLRRTGRTTRLVDEYIQRLFRQKKITISDHHPSYLATKSMIFIIMGRMASEHDITPEIKIINGTTFVELSI